MSYIGTEPKDIRSFGRTKFDYTASQGQTAFTGADDDGKVLAFTTGQINVYVNGILMDDSDFTTTGTGTVTLASAANLNDVISIVSFESNIPDNDYVPASGGTFTGAVTASNGLTVDDDGATVLTVDRATSDGDIIDIQRGGTSAGKIGGTSNVLSIVGKDGDGGIAIQNNSYGDIIYPASNLTGGASDNAIDLGYSTGRWKDLYLSSGIYLGGTGSANHLNDYEEGTYVATLTDAGGSPATIGLYSNYNQLSYIKIGKQVTVYGQIRVYSISGGMSGELRLNLPFVCQTDNTEGQSLHFSSVRSFNGNQVTGGIYLGATSVFNIGAQAAIAWVRGSGQGNIAHTVIANEYLLFTHVYTTD